MYGFHSFSFMFKQMLLRSALCEQNCNQCQFWDENKLKHGDDDDDYDDDYDYDDDDDND